MVLILDGNSEKCEHLYSVNGNFICLSPRLEHQKNLKFFLKKKLLHTCSAIGSIISVMFLVRFEVKVDEGIELFSYVFLEKIC